MKSKVSVCTFTAAFPGTPIYIVSVIAYHSLTSAYTAHTTLKHVFKLYEDIPVTVSGHRPVLHREEEGSSRVYFYTRSLTPTYISSQLLVRTEDTST